MTYADTNQIIAPDDQQSASLPPISLLDQALALASRGLHVFPLGEGGTRPLPGSHGHLDATRDPEEIRRLWTDPVAGPRRFNIGLSPRDGKFVFIDLDEKEGRGGVGNFLAMGGEIGGLVVKTKSGGLHVVYSTDRDLRTNAGELAVGVDVRGPDGYIVAPGSTVDGRTYEIIQDDPILPAPQWLVERLHAATTGRRAAVTTVLVENDRPGNVERFAEICRRAPPAVSGIWHDASRDLACAAVRLAVSAETAMDVLLREWVPRGSGFFDDGRNERWPDDVRGSYEWGLTFGQHGADSIDAAAAAFAGVVIAPAPADEECTPAALPSREALNAAPRWNIRRMADFQGRPVPPRRYIVDQRLQPGHCTLLYADGGTGKSLLAQQLITSAASGRPWLGLPVEQCRAIGLFCEDTEEELLRRQTAINEALGVTFDPPDLECMEWASATGTDNSLASFDSRGRMELTAAYQRLYEWGASFQARLIVLDTAADLFSGNEVSRREVRQFIAEALGSLALRLDAAVLLTAHPSRDGLRGGHAGTQDGGSTAWNNSARSRWALTRPDGRSGEVDPEERILSRRKSNYSATGTELRIRYEQGAFAPITPMTFDEVRKRDLRAEDVFISLLNKVNLSGRDVSHSKQSSSYAPKVFSLHAEREGLTKLVFEGAMARLFAMQRIEVAQRGKPSRPISYLKPKC